MGLTRQEILDLQRLPLNKKIELSKEKIKEWYEYWEGSVYISFSGGKDSTVLSHLCRSIYPNVPNVFIDTGLEWPEIRTFVATFSNTVWLKPTMPFHKVIEKYGYPVVSKTTSQRIYEIRTTKSEKLLNKRLYGDEKKNGKLAEKWKYLINAPFKISDRCCVKLKKNPSKKYERQSGNKPILGTLAEESRQRLFAYEKNGCNSFEQNRPVSNPISFWTEKNIWDYIKKEHLSYCDIYDKGIKRTGCIFCMFGEHNEHGGLFNENKFQILQRLHPKKYDYCMNKLGLKKILPQIGVHYF